MTATNNTPDNEAARDEDRWTHGPIIGAEAAAYAEDARRYPRPGTADRCATPGHVHVHPDTIRTDNGCTLIGRTLAPAPCSHVPPIDGCQCSLLDEPAGLPADFVEPHSVAAMSDRYWTSGCGADVLARTRKDAEALAVASEQDRRDRATVDAMLAAPRAVEEFIRAAAPAVHALLALPVEVPTFFERVAEVRALADDANRVEVEAALPGEWVVSVATSVNDERAAVEWVDLPGRHTLRGAAEQVRHLTIEGYVREVRILRA